MSAVTKITSKYQVTLPREVRRGLKARVGDLLVFSQQSDGSYRVQAIPSGFKAALRLAGSGCRLRISAGSIESLR